MTKQIFDRHPPLRYWSDQDLAVRWLLLIEEDHSFTFRTVEQKYMPGQKYGPN